MPRPLSDSTKNENKDKKSFSVQLNNICMQIEDKGWNLQSLGNFREQHYTVNTNSSSLCNLFAYKMEKLMFLTWFALKRNKSKHRAKPLVKGHASSQACSNQA